LKTNICLVLKTSFVNQNSIFYKVMHKIVNPYLIFCIIIGFIKFNP
jgi:hypothetical protein